jgi:hypothetical protein
MSTPFVKATKTQAKLRLALDGPSGSGKTYTALVAATAIANGGKIAVIDTERGSASLYSDKFDFDVATLDQFSPKNYTDLIRAAENAGYAVIVIDSLSHAWEGEGGALDMVDQATARSQSKNSYFAWREVTPLHRNLVDAMLQSKCHIIATMRSKTEYVIEEIERNGRKTQVPRKIGMAPIQRSGMEYEFSIVGDLDLDHNLVISKTRAEFIDGAVVKKPDEKFFKKILDWLNSGETPKEPPKPGFSPGKPAPTPAPAKPAQPENGKLMGLDGLGQALWPGLWDQRRPEILKACKNDATRALTVVQDRLEKIQDLEEFTKHVAKSWEGYEVLVPMLVEKVGEDFARLAALAGFARAAAEATADWTDSQYVAAIMAELEIPADFR